MIPIFLLGIFSFFQTISVLAQPTLSVQAEDVLNRVVYELQVPSIIGKREWNELQLDLLVTTLARTKTSFGRWGLIKLLHPIADTKELLRRKEIITFLIDHEEDMHIFQEQLARVHNVEKSLLAYWDKSDALNRSCKRFYFSSLGLDALNKSSIALNVSTFLEGFNAIKGLLQVFALWGVSQEITQWTLGVKESFSLKEGIYAGLMEPLMRHSPALYKLKNGPYTARDAARAGSWGDIYSVYKTGFDYQVGQTTKHVPGFGKIGAFLVATMSTLFFDYQWLNSVDFIAKRIASMYRDLNNLHRRVSDVAQCVDAIKTLKSILIKQTPTLRSYLEPEYNAEREDFIKKLLTPDFLKKSDYFYSRGNVLSMHLDITQEKDILIPLLHSVALLDAYCSIAQLYKESQKETITFSFIEFVASEKPLLNYYDAWLPLLSSQQAVSNDLVFGDSKPDKIVITGPNGSGKSTILKTLGIGAVLAQSWGIVPARDAQQTLFSAIRTSFLPQEDLKLSKAMAGIKAMDELKKDIQNSNSQERMLVLIDEPYTGMVDDEAAKRIYQFGKNIVNYPQSLVVLATHTKKPIQLAHDLPGIYGNYQVKINEVYPGVFKRLFKLESGPAMWWFEDEGKRGRFVDWISIKSNSAE